MSQTETKTPLNLDNGIIEHNAIHNLPVLVETEHEAETEADAHISPQPEVSKREKARLKRATLQAEQAQLQKLLDEIEDDSDGDIADLQLQLNDLKAEVANWQQPENPHSVLAQIGLFALAASLICWVISPLIGGQGAYLEGALSVAAVLLGYGAAALLLFVVANANAKSSH